MVWLDHSSPAAGWLKESFSNSTCGFTANIICGEVIYYSVSFPFFLFVSSLSSVRLLLYFVFSCHVFSCCLSSPLILFFSHCLDIMTQDLYAVHGCADSWQGPFGLEMYRLSYKLSQEIKHYFTFNSIMQFRDFF